MAARILGFDGKHLDTTFIMDQDTNHIQYGIEPVSDKVYDLTIAAIDTNNMRKEFVLTADATDLSILASLIQNVLETNKQRNSK